MISPKTIKGKHYLYQFALFCSEGQINLKFPCTFFLKWSVGRPGDVSKLTVNTQNDQSKIVQGKIAFKKTLTMNVHMVYDTQRKMFSQKMSSLAIYLTSTSRPNDQPKMAGFFRIDLSSILNGLNPYETLRIHPLERCPDKNSSITFTIKGKRIQELAMDEVNSDYEDRDIASRFLSENSIQEQSNRTHRQLIILREEKAALEKQLESNRANKDLLNKMSLQLESCMEENARLHKKHEDDRKEWQQINNRLQLELKTELFRHESLKSPRDNDEQLRKALVQETKKVARLEAQRADNLRSWQIITKKLESDIKSLQEDLQQEQSNCSSLNDRIHHLTFDLRDRQSQLATMRQEYGRIAHLYQQKIEQAQSYQDRLEFFSQDLKFVQESSMKLIEQIAQKQAKQEEYLDTIDQLEYRLHNINGQANEILKEQNTKLKQQLEGITERLRQTERKLDEKNKNIQKIEINCEETQDILKKENNELLQSLGLIKEEYRKMQEKNQNLEKIVMTLTKERTKLTKNEEQNFINILSENYEEVSKLKKMLSEKQKVISQLNKSLKSFVEEGHHEENSIESIYHSHIQQSQSQLSQLKKQLLNLNELLFQHEASINEWELKYSRLQEKYRILQRQIKKRDEAIEEYKKNIQEQSLLLVKSRESQVLIQNELNLLKEEYEDLKKTQTMKSRHNSQSSLCREAPSEDKTLASRVTFLAKTLEGYSRRMTDIPISEAKLKSYEKIQDLLQVLIAQKTQLEVSLSNLNQNLNILKVSLLKKANTIDQQRITVSVLRPVSTALTVTRQLAKSLFISSYRKSMAVQPNTLNRSKTSPKLV